MDTSYSYKINSLGIADCKPTWCWDTPKCKDYTIWAVFRGTGTLEVGNQSFHIKEGTCFLLPPNEPIRGRHDPKHPLFVIYIHFDFFKSDTVVHPFPVQRHFIVNLPFFRELLNQLISFHLSDRQKESLAWLNVALIELLNAPAPIENGTIEKEHIRCIQQICKTINENIIEATSLSALAAKFGYSTTYLGKIFHKVTNISFSQYLLNARINQAKTLLRNSNFSVSEIAEQLGYYDSCHFIRQFKSVVGCSPYVYRLKL